MAVLTTAGGYAGRDGIVDVMEELTENEAKEYEVGFVGVVLAGAAESEARFAGEHLGDSRFATAPPSPHLAFSDHRAYSQHPPPRSFSGP